MVKTVKEPLRKILGRALLSFEELTTLLAEIENIVNLRPLTYVSDDKDDPEPLTPFHFLLLSIPGLTICLLLLFLLGTGPSVLCYSAVVLYPAYQSFKSLEEDNKEKSYEWIRYWIVFAAFHAVEHLGDRFMWWLPGYMLLKFIFLLWCFAPVPNNGSAIIYENYIRVMFLRNVETLDRVTDMVTTLIHKIVTKRFSE
ncbi:receptor expression-enhancing protein [Trichonephila clavata]|uniref:Receptor expression-enhancing protein n=1 Tax=Trichonephila clavata TaxID=2740835 RepID=A0A8X6FYC6_TRICU|nr:receptor expression-enhancing protein [Trichonephila clavata]